MKLFSLQVLGSAAAVLSLVSACGGGSGDPEPTPIAATLTVGAATSPTFNGVYTTQAISLAEVVKVNPIGSEPEVCSFRFSGLAKSDGASMSGDIRYIPANPSLHVVFISINGFEFVSRDSVNASVDRGNNKVDFTGKTLTASTGVASAITLTGSVPMRGGRPEGC